MKDKIIIGLRFAGLGFFEPLVRLIAGEEPKKNAQGVFNKIIFPLLSIILFIVFWHMGSKSLFYKEAAIKIEKARKEGGEAQAQKVSDLIDSAYEKLNGSYIIEDDAISKQELASHSGLYAVAIKNNAGSYDIQYQLTSEELSNIPNSLPFPRQVKNAFYVLLLDHKNINLDKDNFLLKVAKTNKKLKESGKKLLEYTGRPSFIDQVKTSIKTVFAGVLLAIFVAVPVGIVFGLSETLRNSLNWIIQIFKPVSPVVWMLLVFMVVKTVVTDPDLDKSFIIAFISVGLCSMWATLVNTSVGVATVDKDFLNVANVLKLSPLKKIFKVVLPASFPLIFTGIRITVSVAWMVLIAIELLVQSPGLGSFVWEEFQNGANDSNAKIIVAMFAIGIIGFILDRIMIMIQRLVTFSKNDIA